MTTRMRSSWSVIGGGTRRARASFCAWSVLVLAAGASAQTSPLSDDALMQEANAFYQVQDWLAAADAYEEMTARDSGRARWWFQLGLCYHNIRRFEEAIPAFERCDELGSMREAARYNIACGYAQLGRPDDALEWLDLAQRAGFRRPDLLRGDSDLDPLRDDSRFRLLAGLEAPPDASRSQGWRFDLDLLALRIDQRHPDPYRHVSAEALRAAFDAIHARVETLSDAEVAHEIQRELARIGDASTRMRGFSDPDRGLRRLPVRLRDLADGLVVVAATAEHADLLGMTVVSIDGVSIEDAHVRCLPFVSADNEHWVRFDVAEWRLTSTDAMHAMGITASPSEAVYELEGPEGTRLQRRLDGVRRSPELEWVELADRAPAPVPQFLLERDRPYRAEFLDDDGVMYIAWNAVEVDGSRRWRRFVGRVLDTLESRQAAALVLDLRHNLNLRETFGRSDLAERLIDAIAREPRINRPGGLFVIVGRETVSGSLRAALELERKTRAIFVGEPTGAAPVHVGAPVLVTLPYGRLRVSIGQEMYGQQLDGDGEEDDRTALIPEMIVERTVADARENRDPALEAILERVRRERILRDRSRTE